MTDWRTLLEQAEDMDERAEIIRVAFMAGVPKAEIDLELERIDSQKKKKTTAEGPST